VSSGRVGIRHFRGYLEGYEFTVITDHQVLRWLQKLESPTRRLGRWMLELQQYSFDVKYRRGTLNRVADALSRLPAVRAIRNPRCPWYFPQLRRVRKQPDAHPDYTVRRGKLYRHILHSTDFRVTSTVERVRAENRTRHYHGPDTRSPHRGAFGHS